MKDQLISFDVAKLAKEKGLDFSSNYFREHEFGDADFDDDFCNWNEYDGYFTIITQSLLQKWLREKKFHHVYVIPITGNKWIYEVKYISLVMDDFISYLLFEQEEYNTYEQALENGLMSALEIIK